MEFIRQYLNRFTNKAKEAIIANALKEGKIPVVCLKNDSQLFYVTEITSQSSTIRGQTISTFTEPSIGHPTLHYEDRALDVVDIIRPEPIAWARSRVEALVNDLMYDEQVCVFQSERGKRYYISSNARHHDEGFVAYEEETNYAAFFNWTMLQRYRGDWFPDDMLVEKRQHFVYYDWMGNNVRDKSIIPGPTPKESIIKEIKTLKEGIRRLEKYAIENQD